MKILKKLYLAIFFSLSTIAWTVEVISTANLQANNDVVRYGLVHSPDNNHWNVISWYFFAYPGEKGVLIPILDVNDQLVQVFAKERNYSIGLPSNSTLTAFAVDGGYSYTVSGSVSEPYTLKNQDGKDVVTKKDELKMEYAQYNIIELVTNRKCYADDTSFFRQSRNEIADPTGFHSLLSQLYVLRDDNPHYRIFFSLVSDPELGNPITTSGSNIHIFEKLGSIANPYIAKGAGISTSILTQAENIFDTVINTIVNIFKKQKIVVNSLMSVSSNLNMPKPLYNSTQSSVAVGSGPTSSSGNSTSVIQLYFVIDYGGDGSNHAMYLHPNTFVAAPGPISMQ